MKKLKVGYILSILLALLVLWSIYSQSQTGNIGNSAAFNAFFAVIVLAGGVGGMMQKGWAKKVAMISVGAVAITQILQSSILGAAVGAVVFGILFFAE